MSATLVNQPATPASAYRPLEFVVRRDDPAVKQVYYVKQADAADVSAVGAGILQVGDIFLNHQAWAGPVAGTTGQTIVLGDDCAPYSGVWTVLDTWNIGANHYTIIDAPNLGTFTPVSPATSGRGNVWLNNYTVWCELSVYTSPTAAPAVVYLPAVPDAASGEALFNVAPVVATYFSDDLDPYARPWSGTWIQQAHGLTAMWYRVRFVEVYDIPGVIAPVNPWEDGTEIHADSTHRVAVNAIHPYHDALATWEDADMGVFSVGASDRLFLTNAPRSMSIGVLDNFRLFMLTETGGMVNHTLKVDSLAPDGTPTNIVSAYLTAGADPVAAFAIACGPADVGQLVTIPDRYRVYLLDSEDDPASEVFTFTVNRACTEVRRPMAALNKLGGVDLYSFTGREIASSTTRRTTVRKDMSGGQGHDWSERMHKATPVRSFTLSTVPIAAAVRKWLVNDMTEAAAAVLVLSATQSTKVVFTSGDLVAANSGPYHKPLTITYRRGTDNATQEA